MRSRFVAVATLAVSLVALAPTSYAGGDVKLLVLMEHGVGTASQAQPFIDKLVDLAKAKQGWSTAKGTYKTERSEAVDFLKSDKPQYAIMTLSGFLGLRDAQHLETIGQASSSRAGGKEYRLVSKSATDVAGCKGDKLATDLSADAKFVDKVVSGGAFKLSDFTVVATKRPLEGAKKVINGEAKCALVDDAVFAAIANMDGGKDLKAAWKGSTLPPMVVVATASADAKDKASFKGNLSSLCSGDGAKVCKDAGIESLKAASDADYKTVIDAYNKP